jgi:hypothetical protein
MLLSERSQPLGSSSTQEKPQMIAGSSSHGLTLAMVEELQAAASTSV